MKYINKLLFAMATIMAVSSCVNEVDDVFDKPSSQRVAETMAADKAILVGQPNGWVLKIYGNMDFGGYNVLLKFNEDNSLRVVSEAYYGGIGSTDYGQSDEFEVETAHYKLEQSGGVVLSFDEFSKNFHFFSDPANPAGMGPNYRGFFADLEFRVLSASADSVVLQGKKHGNHLVMLPCPKAESEWQSYLDEVFTVENDMAYANYNLNMDGESYPVKISYRNISVTIPGEEGNEYADIPYTVTPEGFEFYEPVEVKGKMLKGFKYAPSTLIYQEMDNSDVTLEGLVPPTNQQFIGSTWYASLSNIGAFGTPKWNVIKNEAMPAIGEQLVVFTFGEVYGGVKSSLGDFFGVTFASYDGAATYWGGFNFQYELVGDNQIKLAYVDPVATTTNSAWYFANASFKNLLMPFGCDADGVGVVRTFNLELDDPKNPSQVKMTDVDNPDNVIVLSAQQIVYPLLQ